jgi:hypothetical protein
MIDSWEFFRAAIRREYGILDGNFLRGQTITRTLAPDNKQLAESYAEQLRKTVPGIELLHRARDPDYGWPRRYKHADFCSMVAAQHAWQLQVLGEQLGIGIPDLTHVSEIGGGYGDMCRQLHSAGFAGAYTIFDFPELQPLQAEYLRRCGVAPTFARLDPATFETPIGKTLLLATFSISEMPPPLRQTLLPMMFAHDYLMLSWNPTFGSWDNEALFADMNRCLQGSFTTMIVRDPYMRAGYLFARRGA